MDIKDVEALAELSRLELSQTEKETILKDMGGILDYVKSIESVEVGDVSPEHSLTNVWRSDEARPCQFDKDIIINQFPEAQDGFLKIKKIL